MAEPVINLDEMVVEPEVEVETPPVKSETELLREKIVTAQEELNKPPEKPETKPEEEIVEDIDLDKLFDEFPDIASMVKDSKEPIKEILKRYSGGLKDFNKDHNYIAELEKAGINTDNLKQELLAKLRTGQLKPDEQKPVETQKSFKELRRDRFLETIPKTRKNELNEDVLVSEQEQKSTLDEIDSFAEKIFPSAVAETIDQTKSLSYNTLDKLEFLLFRLKPIMEKFKDELIPMETQKEIEDYFKPYPAVSQEIAYKAIKEGKNIYDGLYEYFVMKTKSDKIAEEKVTKILAQREADLKKKKDAQTIESKNKVTPLTTDKVLDKTKTPQQLWG